MLLYSLIPCPIAFYLIFTNKRAVVLEALQSSAWRIGASGEEPSKTLSIPRANLRARCRDNVLSASISCEYNAKLRCEFFGGAEFARENEKHLCLGFESEREILWLMGTTVDASIL